MHIPSERIYNRMCVEAASIWFVPANDGTESSLLIKVPTPTLKALTVGCPIRLLFGKKDTYLCIGARIEDMPDTPVLLSGAQIVEEEHEALIRAMKQKLMTCGDWDGISKQLLEAMKETGALFHLLDLREFITLLQQSSGDPKLIDYNLVERCKFFLEKKSVFIRGI